MIVFNSLWILVFFRDNKAAVVLHQTENYTLNESINKMKIKPTSGFLNVVLNNVSTARGPVFGEEAYEDEIYGYQYEWFYILRDYFKKNWKTIRANLLFLIFFILFRIFFYR